jgi:hypothetical protein
VAYVDPPAVTFEVIAVAMLVVTVLTSSVPFTAKIPPSGTVSGGDVEVVAFLASLVKAASVLPVAGALMAATMPDWQWLSVVCEQ